ncbi:hypothetical protein P029_02050 [Anaplasma phagocytophilum str. Norway variant2]|uniref:Uncharacterized protein n=1 Tax=Anaplasma phagocytophilum str. Norway variant2 TaxID=1392507 RepID=A0A161I5P6_ANAPH|nr:hypothetical protein P029_02050 [Anaplasma phagocytophilum str. Norway variant2]
MGCLDSLMRCFKVLLLYDVIGLYQAAFEACVQYLPIDSGVISDEIMRFWQDLLDLCLLG